MSEGSLSSNEGPLSNHSSEEDDPEECDKQKHSLSIRVQKKIFGKAFTKSFISMIDEDTGIILNTLYSLIKEYCGQANKSKKVVKYLIRILIKVGVLLKNNAFNEAESLLFSDFKTKYRTTALTFISFYEVKFTYDQQILQDLFKDIFDLLKQITRRHISSKSQEKINIVEETLRDKDMLDELFSGEEAKGIGRHLFLICTRVKNLIDDGKI